jgi:hypothetical protein
LSTSSNKSSCKRRRLYGTFNPRCNHSQEKKESNCSRHVPIHMEAKTLGIYIYFPIWLLVNYNTTDWLKFHGTNKCFQIEQNSKWGNEQNPISCAQLMLPLNFKACPLSNVKLAKKCYPEKYSNSRENYQNCIIIIPQFSDPNSSWKYSCVFSNVNQIELGSHNCLLIHWLLKDLMPQITDYSCSPCSSVGPKAILYTDMGQWATDKNFECMRYLSSH